MSDIKYYLNKENAKTLVDGVKRNFAPISHAHTKNDIEDLTFDSSLSSTSTNAVQNKTVTSALNLKVPTSRTINGKALTNNISLSASDVSADPSGSANSALASAKTYTDSAVATVKNDLLNGAGTAYDTLKELGDLIDDNIDAIDALEVVATNKADKNHTHDDRYYTETEINSKVSTLNSAIAEKANSSHSHTIANVTNLQSSLDEKASSGHTHKYAGSSSVGGAATSANKINTDAGSATQPVYFVNGVPVATTYTLGKSVPSDAKFTDTNTHYTSKNVVGATNATSNTSAVLSNGAVYINSVENGEVTSSHKISGSGATTVTTDTNGNIIISSTDNNTTYGAAGSALGLVKSGGDVTISSGVVTVNDDSHNHTIANVDDLQAALDGKAASGHTHGAATTSAAGFMTAVMVTKLNGIATGANAYSHPTYTARTGVPTANQTPAFGSTFTVSQPVSDDTGHITAINSRTITIPSAVATTSANGLMSKSDKSKLDGMVLATVSEVETYLGI